MGQPNSSRRHATRRNKQRQQRSALPLFIVGAGLLLIGIAAVFMLPKSRTSANVPDVPNDGSSVPAPVEYPAPELTLTDLTGSETSLADYQGQVVLVNLWATWCPPCKAELPILQAYYEKHAREGFVIIGIEDGEPSDEVAAFIKTRDLTYPIWIDQEGKTEIAFMTFTLPSSYVIDRTGTVRLAWTGAISDAMLEKYVTPIIAE
ncbi:MAG: redoxin domain-containing protein [Chloroflexi bacterium]|nr:redoxin domain-containing protein [Chloroflexota bacterium]